MNLKQTRLVTDDVDRLTRFYEAVTGATAEIINQAYVEFQRSPCAGLAIASSVLTQVYGADALAVGSNRSMVIDFEVADVDAEYLRLRDTVEAWVQPPATMPWGNRAMLLRDPDGNLINMFAARS